MATRLHHDDDVAAALEAAASANDDAWVTVSGQQGTKALEALLDGRRFVVVSSAEKKVRDDRRREELLALTEQKVIVLLEWVRKGQLTVPAKVGASADRILRDSGAARCLATTSRVGFFSWGYDEGALEFEENLLAGRYVLATSLTNEQASTADVVRHYKMLKNVEHRFRTMKDFLGLRPVLHRLEDRVRGHLALCAIDRSHDRERLGTSRSQGP